MKQRIFLSVDRATARYLNLRARQETNGDMSALVDRIVRSQQLVEALQAEVAWYEAHPGYVEAAEIERHAATTA